MMNNEKLTNLLISAQLYAQDKADTNNRLFCLNDEAEYLANNGLTLVPETGIGDLSDGYHTFNELYHHRAILFSVICNTFKDRAWKSKKHDDGSMFDNMFIVGIDTPEGQATYHYDIKPYWDMFQVKELPNAPKWDGHTSKEAIRRIGTLKTDTIISLPCKAGDTVYYFNEDFGVVLPYFVESLNISYLDKDRLVYQYTANCTNPEESELLDSIDFEPEDIGKTVFLNEKDAKNNNY